MWVDIQVLLCDALASIALYLSSSVDGLVECECCLYKVLSKFKCPLCAKEADSLEIRP